MRLLPLACAAAIALIPSTGTGTPKLSSEIELVPADGPAWQRTRRDVASVASATFGVVSVWADGPRDSTDAALVVAIGNQLSEMPLTTLSAGVEDAAPRVADAGNGFVVVWERRQGGDRDVWAQVVGQNATPIASPLAIADGAGNAFEPDVSCDGSGCLVVWRDDAGAIRLRRLDPETSSLLGDEVTLLAAGGAHPEIESGAGVHLVLFGSENALRGQRVAPDGSAVGSAFDLATASNGSLATDAGGFMTAFREGSQVRMRRVRFDGAMEPAVDVAGAAAQGGAPPAIAATGAYFLLAWEAASKGESAALRATLLRPDGVVIGEEATIATTLVPGARVTAALSPLRIDVAYPSALSGASSISARSFDLVTQRWETGTELAEGGASSQSLTAAVPGPGGHLVLWQESGALQLTQGAMVNDGGALAGDPFEVDLSFAWGGYGPPSLGATSAGFYAAWSEYSSQNGQPMTLLRGIGPNSGVGDVLVAAGARMVTTAAHDSDVIVITRGNYSEPVSAYLVRPKDVLGPIVLSTDTGFGAPYQVTWNGTHWTVLWAESDGVAGQQVVARRLDATAALLDEKPRVVVDGFMNYPVLAAASSGGTGLVVTVDQDGIGRLAAQRLSADAAPLGAPIELASGEDGTAYGPQVIAVPGGFLVAWSEQPAGGADSVVRLARVTADGSVADGTTLPELAGVNPVLLATGGARALLPYSRWVSEPGYGVNRVRLRALDLESTGEEGGGCGCRVAPAARAHGHWGWLSLLAVALWRRRRK